MGVVWLISLAVVGGGDVTALLHIQFLGEVAHVGQTRDTYLRGSYDERVRRPTFVLYVEVRVRHIGKITPLSLNLRATRR